jgi:hypothetical protein
MRNQLIIALSTILLLCGPAASASVDLSISYPPFEPGQSGKIIATVASPERGAVHIIDEGEWQRIELDGFHPLMSPGKPMLPSRSFLIALPPGARVSSVTVEGTDLVQLPGAYRIKPVPPILPLDHVSSHDAPIKRAWQDWESNHEAVYHSDRPYPIECGKLAGAGTLRKHSFASVSFCPFRYSPRSGMLYYFREATITIEYNLPDPESPEALRIREALYDTLADERALRLFVNYPDVEKMYRLEASPSASKSQIPWKRFTYDYVVLTDPTLVSAISSSNFLSWKRTLGYHVRIVTTDDERITSQPGIDLAEQIRNFLRMHYIPWGIEYVLLVGDYQTVPMRYCYPDPSNHRFDPNDSSSGEVPTDAYYADLSLPDSESWDQDGDGYPGEYEEDSPDFLPEVCVGRIPTNNVTRITYTLDKLVTFEQDTGSWKNSALHAGAFWYFENEDHSGVPVYDGATCMDVIETNLMDGWTVSHYSEQGGLVPSAYDWPALTWEAFTSDWREGEYSIVNWGAHGSQTCAARKVWSWDDGDGVPEYNEMAWDNFISTDANLDDDHPSIYFGISCLTGYPESRFGGRLGIDLLTEPSWGAAVGSIGATRVAYGILGWPESPGGSESICYEFNRHMIDGPAGPEKVGEALLDAKCYCNQHFPLEHFGEYLNLFTFNLYGDPSLVREGIDAP